MGGFVSTDDNEENKNWYLYLNLVTLLFNFRVYLVERSSFLDCHFLKFSAVDAI